MKFNYADVTYALADPDTWTTQELIKMHRFSGLKAGELMAELADATPIGTHCGVWVSLRRAGLDVSLEGLDMPWLATIESFAGEPAAVAPDPSTASTGAPKAGQRTRSANARSAKKSPSTSP